MRLDRYLIEYGLVRSRSEAQRRIKGNDVLVNHHITNKASYDVSKDDVVELIGSGCPYVSRGGLKLKGALDAFGVDPSGLVAIDIGASTGGFTDCLLQHGATFVYAVENGHSQLDVTLQEHPQVLSLENYNARDLKKSDFPKPIQLGVMDVSFISQTLILPSLYHVLEDGATLITLIKPQFEAGKHALGKGGIVKEQKTREKARDTVLAFASSLGFLVAGCIESPILGGDGNVEYLAYFIKK